MFIDFKKLIFLKTKSLFAHSSKSIEDLPMSKNFILLFSNETFFYERKSHYLFVSTCVLQYINTFWLYFYNFPCMLNKIYQKIVLIALETISENLYVYKKFYYFFLLS